MTRSIEADAHTPEALRRKAAECRRKAAESRDPWIADDLAQLAEAYLERAQEVEREEPNL